MDTNLLLLQKQRHLAELSSAYLSYETSEISYQQLCDDLHELSGAAYTVINLLTHDHKATKTVAISEPAKNLQKAVSIFGFNLIGKEWPVDEFTIKAMKTTRLINQVAVGKASPLNTAKIGTLLKTTFGIGNIYSVGLFRKEQITGTLVLVMKKGEAPPYPELVEIFAQQVGALLYQIDQKNKLAQKNVSNQIIANKLAQSETLLRGLFELSPFGIILNDFETGNFVEVNDALIKQIGYSREELFVLSFLEVTPKEYSQQEEIQLELLKNTGRYGPYEKEYIRKDGTRYPVVLNGMITLDANGKKMIWSIVEDITERRRAESELEAKLKEIQDITNAVNENSLVSIIDKKGDIVKVNSKFCEVSRYTEAELIGQNYRIINSSYHDKIFWRDLWHTISRGKVWKGEIKNRAKDGTEYWEASVINPIFDKNGIISHYLSIRQDITERKKAELDLLETQQKLNSIFTEMEDVVWSMQLPDYKVLFMTPSAIDLFGIPFETLMANNRWWEKVIHPEDKAVIRKIYKQLNDKGSFEEEYRIISLDGTVKWISNKGKIITDKNGAPQRLDGYMRNISAYKFADQQLRNSEAQLKEAHSIAKLGHWELDLADNRLNWSDSVFEIFEKDPEKFAPGYEEFLNTIHPDDREALDKAYTDSLANKTSYAIEHRLLMPDGRVKWLRENCRTKYNANGKALSSVGIVQDITESKVAALELLQTKDLLARTNTVARVGGWEVDLVNYGLYWTEITKEIHEVSPDFKPDLKTSINFYKEGESRNKITKLVNKAIETGERFDVELQIITAQDREVWIRAIGQTEFENNQCIRLYGTFQDIDKAKKAEELIIRQNQFRQLIAEISGEFVKSDFSTTDAVINKILQKCGAYFDVDRCFLFQISSEERTFSNTHDWHREGTESMQHRVQNMPLTTFPWFVAKLTEQDTFIISDVAQVPAEAEAEKREWINQHMKSILFVRFDYNNQPAGVLGLSTISRIMDWTEDQVSGLGVFAHIISDGLVKVTLEKGLIEAKEKAENANKAKSEFLANISHEIRTPLNSILGFSEILLQSIHEPKAAGQLKTIQSSGRILLSLINDLLDLAKIEAGQLSLQADSVDVRALVDEIYQMFLPQTTKKNLNLFTEFSSSFPRQVMIDDIRLKQMIVNLVGNAVKFTQQGSIKIHVDFSHINPNQSIGCLQFSVEDTGMGIAQTDLETIFESFRQGAEQSVRHYGGTGLGLSITKRLVDLMQGELSVSSQKGKGSVFTLTIPDVTYVEYVKGSSNKNSTEKLHFKDATILVVDDVATNRKLVADYLSHHDITLIMGTNGLEAITLAKTHHPDLILMDIRMPEMDGREAARIIHETEDLKDIPIIAFTASILAHETIDGYFAGMLSKPIQGKVLFDELKKYIPYDTVMATASHSENQDEQTTQEELQAHLPYLQEHFQSTIDRLTYMMDVTEMEQLLNHLKAYAKQHKLKQLLNLTAQLEAAFDQFDLDNISIELQRLSILLNN